MNTQTIPSTEMRNWMDELLTRADNANDVATKVDSDGKYIRTPWALCTEIVEQIAQSAGNMSTKTVLVVDTVEFIPVLLSFGVNKCNITYVAPYEFKGKIASSLGATVEQTSLLDWENNMKFDVVVGNPPYNVGTDKTTTGTGGGTSKLFLKFVKEGFKRVSAGGFIGFVTPKGVRGTLLNHKDFQNATIRCYNLMTGIDAWEYDTCFWVAEKSVKRLHTIPVTDYAVNKFYSLDQSESFQFKYVNKSDKELQRENAFGSGQAVVRYLPGSRSSSITLDKSNSKDIIFGTKMVTTILNSKSATVVTDQPVLAGTTLSFITNSIADAEKLKLFFDKNLAFKFLVESGKFKSKSKALTYVKKFNLSQIITGLEYPTEWCLTQEEIDYIEATVK